MSKKLKLLILLTDVMFTYVNLQRLKCNTARKRKKLHKVTHSLYTKHIADAEQGD